MANMNRTKVITGINTKLSYFHGWEPVSINGGGGCKNASQRFVLCKGVFDRKK